MLGVRELRVLIENKKIQPINRLDFLFSILNYETSFHDFCRDSVEFKRA